MPKPEKMEAVSGLKEQMENASSVFVTEYTGLNVHDITILRKNLRENSVKYIIAKNTLMKIAAKEAGLDDIIDYLRGQTALAFGADDPAVAAKILYDSYKEIEKPVIRAFILDGQLFSGDEITRLANLPSREILLSQVVSAVESPISGIVSSVDGLFQELVATVDALQASRV
ncbi:MAG TPA: 50S ribosomal protein L10 [candidate division Zixibacteria bacterium]|nr:50S ribosomal protein L10 [candidate division Zixibacteria bacterium]